MSIETVDPEIMARLIQVHREATYRALRSTTRPEAVAFVRTFDNPHAFYTFGKDARVIRALLGPAGRDRLGRGEIYDYDLCHPGRTQPYGMAIVGRAAVGVVMLELAEGGHPTSVEVVSQ